MIANKDFTIGKVAQIFKVNVIWSLVGRLSRTAIVGAFRTRRAVMT